MDEQLRRTRSWRLLAWMACCVLSTMWVGCRSIQRWPGFRPPCVLDPGVSQDQLVQHLNRNITGTPEQGGLVSWQASNAKINVTGVPLPLPTSIAVEAPRNLRILVSNPMTRGQEVDIGSNPERFWFWSKEAPGIMTCKHEDVSTAASHMNLPIQIDPDWMMEIFGVIPIDNSKYTMLRPTVGVAELVSKQQQASGKIMERVIRVDTCQGVITDHLLRDATGSVIAVAHLDKYAESPTGVLLPMVYKFEWPAAKVGMTIHLNAPQTNPASLASNSSLWNVPNLPGVDVVDVGERARRAIGPITPAGGQVTELTSPVPGQPTRQEAAGIIRLEAPTPAGFGNSPVANPFMPPTHRPANGPAPFPSFAN